MECLPQVLIEFKSTDLDQNVCVADTVASNECNCTNSWGFAYMLTFAFMHHSYLVCILFGMPSLHLFTFLMFFIFFCNCATNQKKKVRNKASRHIYTGSKVHCTMTSFRCRTTVEFIIEKIILTFHQLRLRLMKLLSFDNSTYCAGDYIV